MAERQLPTIRSLIFGLLLSNLAGCTLGKLECEDLPIEDCAFSVASAGTRCVLENYRGKDNSIQYECQSSIITAEKQEEWIESDECVNACGLERMSVGLSTDLLMDDHFTEMLCSSDCLNNCPNIIDLYISLAAGEGMYLPQLCDDVTRVTPDPVEMKAMDGDHLRNLTSGGATMAPHGSPTPENGGIPSNSSPKGPDYNGYGGHEGEFAPSSPVAGSDTAPGATAPSKPPAGSSFLTKRPFFFIASSPPTASATTSFIPDGAVITPMAGPATTPSPSRSESAPAPSTEVFWPQELSVNSFLNDQQMNDESSWNDKTQFNLDHIKP